MRTLSIRLLPLLLLVASACAHRPASPLAALEKASNSGPGAAAKDQALAGHHALWVAGDVDAARARFDAALEKDPNAPLAHLGQLMLAERAVAPRRQLEAALTLVKRAPSHPASAIAARQLLDLVGQVTVWDAELRETLPPLLSLALLPETRVLLHSALAELASHAGDNETMDRHLDALGVVRRYAMVGPLSAHTWLDPETDTLATILRTGSLAGTLNGPTGEALTVRTLSFTDGRLSLGDEPFRGDRYVLSTDVELAQGGTYALRAASPSSLRVWMNGTEVLSREPARRETSMLVSTGVRLEPGRHRILVELTRAGAGGALSLTLMPMEGQPSPVMQEGLGEAPRWDGVRTVALPGLHPDAASVAEAFSRETGEGLARLLAAWDSQGRDQDGAHAQLSPLTDLLSSPAFLTLRAEVSLRDRSIPGKVAQGRAMRDLEAALAKDAGATWARMRLAALVLEQERTSDATALLAPALAESPSYPLQLTQARIARALGVDAQAGALAAEALETQPGICAALELRYELAQKRDAVSEADALIQGPLSACPNARGRLAAWARTRGKPEQALSVLEPLAVRAPTNVSIALERARILEALDRSDEAIEVLQSMRRYWPTQHHLLERLADVHERAGDRNAALALREEVLRLNGGDLSLRRAIERARTGKELLENEAISTEAALEAYAKQHRSESTAVAMVLDAGAVRAYPDGSQVSRIHTIHKVLTQGGVSEVAEVNLPPGAQVLQLRTLKPDGTVFEPEPIAGKDSISLPNVEVGDFVDIEYLVSEGPRDLSMPGFTAAGFYYRLLGQPNHWVSYKVMAPTELQMKVEGRNLEKAPKVTTEGGLNVYHHEQHDLGPIAPEPARPPDPREFMPMVDVGGGVLGQEPLITRWADAFFNRGAITYDVTQFAREAQGDAKGLEAVKAIYVAVHDRLTGNDAGLGMTAASSLAQDRGSRLWATKAALEAAGFPTRLVAVRTFNVVPEPSIFPDGAAVGYVGLRVTVPGQSAPVWLDTSTRYAPFGELPEAAGGMPAWVLPEPGRPLEAVTTPAPPKTIEKDIRLTLTLSPEGELTGEGVETYRGFEAAALSEALSRVAGDRRRQGVEQALSRYFGGMRVGDLDLTLVDSPGEPLVMRYTFTADRAARVEGSSLALSPLTFPAQLGQRFVTVGKRELPLFIGASERSHSTVVLNLPEGYTLDSVVPPVKEQSAFGSYLRTEKLEGSVLTLEETLELERGRIAPADYGRFGAWAGSVDLIQGRDFRVVPAKTATKTASVSAVR